MNYQFFEFPFYKNSAKANEIGSVETDQINDIIFLKKEEITDELMAFASKILGAVQLDMNKNALVHAIDDHSNYRITDILRAHPNCNILIFGINSNNLGLQISTVPYKIYNIQNHKLLFAHKLGDLIKNTNYKKQLWTKLQELYKQ